MAEIISINGAEVKIGQDDGKVITVPIASVRYANPREGDKVQVYQDGKDYIIQRLDGCPTGDGKSINKHVFVWVGNFLFGGFGVDRFMRGQTGLGIFKLLLTFFGWIPFGIGTIAVWWVWVMVDWITSMIKAYGSAYGADECITFDANGNYTR